MAKKFSNTRCVHCLEYFEELTSDHVLPKSWYPDDTPDNLEKWQVPACRNCNWEHGKNEETLLSKLALHFDPEDGDFKRIAKKASRSMSPKDGKSKRDCEKRQKQKMRIMNELQQVSKSSWYISNILPGFGFDTRFSQQEQPPLLVSAEQLRKLGEKVTRGVFYLINNMYIESDYEITVYVPAENFPQQCRQVISQYGKEYNCGDGISVVMAVCFDDINSAILEITIWGRLKICSVIIPHKSI